MCEEMLDEGTRKRGKDGKTQDRRVAKIDPTDIRKVIYAIDAYRSHIYYDLSWVGPFVERGSLGRQFTENWKDLQRKLIKMASITGSIPGLVRMARFQNFFEALYQIAIPVMFVMLFAGIFAPGLEIVRTIAPYAAVFGFSTMIVGLLSRFFIGHRIAKRVDAYFVQNPEAQKLRQLDVRDAVQGLIDELRRYLSITEESPEKHLVGIALLDYQNIEVVKKPRPWRKYYLVSVTP